MIKVTQNYFDRTIQAISDTEQQIANNLNGSFVESYYLHLSALQKLVLELEVVDNLSSSESFEQMNRLYERMEFFKTEFVV